MSTSSKRVRAVPSVTPTLSRVVRVQVKGKVYWKCRAVPPSSLRLRIRNPSWKPPPRIALKDVVARNQNHATKDSFSMKIIRTLSKFARQICTLMSITILLHFVCNRRQVDGNRSSASTPDAQGLRHHRLRSQVHGSQNQASILVCRDSSSDPEITRQCHKELFANAQWCMIGGVRNRHTPSSTHPTQQRRINILFKRRSYDET